MHMSSKMRRLDEHQLFCRFMLLILRFGPTIMLQQWLNSQILSRLIRNLVLLSLSKSSGVLSATSHDVHGRTVSNSLVILQIGKQKEKPTSTTASNAQLRNLPSTLNANQVNVDSAQSSSSISQMQQQINQFKQMMQMFVGSNKGYKSPEDHWYGFFKLI